MRELRFRNYFYFVGKFDFASGFMVDARVLDVLYQGPCAPHIERLQAIADSQDGLVQVVCILQQELVNIIASWIGGRRPGVAFGPKLLRIDICRAPWKQHAFAARNRPVPAIGLPCSSSLE